MKLKFARIWVSLAIVLAAFLGSQIGNVKAQTNNSPWSQCTDGRVIVRCETYDCPNGDTNKDGKCTSADTGGRLTDARNDSFCANPLSGCGQVNYFAPNDSNSCSVRVEETGNNCDLYSVSNPNFTPKPSSSPTPTPSPTPQGSTSSVCKNLTATPFEGTVPLRVTFKADASDPAGNIKEYQFEFKKEGSSVGTVIQSSPSVSQTFDKVGVYSAKVTITDSSGKKVTSPTCQTTITVRQAGSLPETGSNMWIGLGIVAIGITGAYMYEKFRVI